MKIVSKHGVEEEIRRGTPRAVLYILKKSSITDALRKLAEEKEVPVKFLSHQKPKVDENERGFYLEVPDTQTTEVDWDRFLEQEKTEEAGLILILDGITDPQNFGAILRSAEQFQVKLVVSASRRAAPLGPGAIAASSGAHVWVPRSTVPNLSRALEQIKEAGYWVYGADMAGENLSSVGFAKKNALVMGGEGKGLGRLVAEKCDSLVRIPTTGRLDSLNVSVSAGILLYAARIPVSGKNKG